MANFALACKQKMLRTVWPRTYRNHEPFLATDGVAYCRQGVTGIRRIAVIQFRILISFGDYQDGGNRCGNHLKRYCLIHRHSANAPYPKAAQPSHVTTHAHAAALGLPTSGSIKALNKRNERNAHMLPQIQRRILLHFILLARRSVQRCRACRNTYHPERR